MTRIASFLFPASRSLQLTAVVAAVAVASWACTQGTPTSPTGQLPALGASAASASSGTLLPLGKPTVTNYTYGITGDIVVGDSDAVQNVGSGIVLSGSGSFDQLTFSGIFLGNFADGEDCFGAGPITFAGALRPDKKDSSIVNVEIYFDAKGTDGATDFHYALTGSGTTGGAFPPEVGSTTIDWIPGTFSMNTEGSGKGKRGGNEGSACVGDGLEVGGAVTVSVAS